MDHLLYGAAYYDEYMPYERLDQDITMMKAAGMNVVRIGESTWSTCEPQPGIFDFSHVTRVIEAMGAAGIDVIIGTPTYAVPSWMVKSHPDILAETHKGRGIYGPRQIMDITHPAYLFYAERVIRKMMEECAHYPNVIGVQLDNETKPYDTAGPNVQRAFIKYLREKFHDDLDALNRAYGLDYWSNRINAWEDFPDVRGTINGSLGAAFAQFQQKLVADFLMWQRKIVEPYLRPDQFITHNTDFQWHGFSDGLLDETDVFETAKALTVVGTDIYHPSQDHLTGVEIAFGGDVARSVKKDNYLVLETQAQGFPQWLPYPGQLRLQAYAHLAGGADMAEYWHWHSLHNACETYWKGVLSHDFKENDTYRACKIIGNEWKRIGDHLIHLKKENHIAILVSSTAQLALNQFPIAENYGYNDVLKALYRALYHRNLECDFIWAQNAERMKDYDLVLIPALYAASQTLLDQIEEYVRCGGHVLATFKTAFADENVKVWPDEAPHTLAKVFGISYSHFTVPEHVGIRWVVLDPASARENPGHKDSEKHTALHFMELLQPEGAQVLAVYDHPAWNPYAAVTENQYEEGWAAYIGCGLPDRMLEGFVTYAASRAGITAPAHRFPLIIRKGINQFQRSITYVLNFSGEAREYLCEMDGVELLSNTRTKKGELRLISPWNLIIVES